MLSGHYIFGYWIPLVVEELRTWSCRWRIIDSDGIDRLKICVRELGMVYFSIVFTILLDILVVPPQRRGGARCLDVQADGMPAGVLLSYMTGRAQHF